MGTEIYLYGASGHCKVIIDIVQSNNDKVTAIWDDNPKVSKLFNIPVIHTKSTYDFSCSKLIISIGENAIRRIKANTLAAHFYTAIHPRAIISKYGTIGEGSVVMAGVILNPSVVIGKHCIINTGAVIDHDCTINDFVHVSPNVSLAGHISIGEGTHIGIGASIIQGVKIGKWVMVGAGTVILRDIPDYAVVVGVPGRIIKYKKTMEDE